MDRIRGRKARVRYTGADLIERQTIDGTDVEGFEAKREGLFVKRRQRIDYRSQTFRKPVLDHSVLDSREGTPEVPRNVSGGVAEGGAATECRLPATIGIW